MTLPWPQPKTAYESDGPEHALTFTEQDVSFKVEPTGEIGFNTGRRRYRIECLTCHEVLHKHSTSATHHVQDHLKRRHTPWPVGERLLSSKVSKEEGSWGEITYWRVLEFETCVVRFCEDFEDHKLPPNGDHTVWCEVEKKK
jgi:hypothetical protein